MIYVKGSFKPGHEIEIEGQSGVVVKTTLSDTRLKRGDGSVVIVPNRKFVGTTLVNKSLRRNRALSSTLLVSALESTMRVEYFSNEVVRELGEQPQFFRAGSDLLDYNENGHFVRFSVYVNSDYSFSKCRTIFHTLIANVVQLDKIILGAPPEDVVVHNVQVDDA